MRLRCLIPLALLFVVACNPPPVDPDAIFTIKGSLANAVDSSPGSGVDVYVYKVDSIFRREDNFLQYASVDAGVLPNATYSTQTDANGDFAIDLEGRQVNTDGGGGAAWLAAVYFDNGTEDAYLATATDWHAFSDADPIWDVGTIKLWDGGAASQSGDMVTFDWGSPAAPVGHQRDTGFPSFLFAWDNGSTDLRPRWAEHSFNSSADVPRAAFQNNRPNGPEFFITTFSQPTGRSSFYQHRSDLLYVVTGWTQLASGTELITQDALKEGGTNTAFSNNNANDGDMDTEYNFIGDIRDIYIDLQSPQAFDYVLLHNLGVSFMHRAIITINTSSDDSTAPSNWTQLGSAINGDWEFENWIYAWSGGTTARWIHVQVDRSGSTGSFPAFEFLGEVSVVSP